MNKKSAVIICALVLILSVAAVGTAAYFNTQVRTRNVITTGKINIDLLCDGRSCSGSKTVLDLKDVMPGAVISTDCAVKNTGTGEAWIRVKLVPGITAADGGELETGVFSAAFNEEDWINDGEYRYYIHPVAPGDETGILYDSLSFDISMGNEYQQAKAQLKITAQAVQTANNSPADELTKENYKEVLGWPSEE